MVYNFIPSYVSIMTNWGIDFLFPVFDWLISNKITKADNIIGYLFESIKIFIKNLNHFPNYLRYLKDTLNFDLQLEMLYRSVFEHWGVPDKLLNIKEINKLFLINNQSILFYADILKFVLFSDNSTVMKNENLLFTSSEFYKSRRKTSLEQITVWAEDLVVKRLMTSKNSSLDLGLLFDLYFRLKEYCFLREIFLNIINNQEDGKPNVVKNRLLLAELQKLMMYYVSQVDMNLAAIKSTSQIERYIRVADLLTQYMIDSNPVFVYAIIDVIYKRIKISQFEKPFKRKGRSGSFMYQSKLAKNNDPIETNKIENLNIDFLDYVPKSDKRNSIIVNSIGLDITENEEHFKENNHKINKKYDIFLSILLGKLIVLFVNLKKRMGKSNTVKSDEDSLLWRNIYDAIDWSNLILEIYNWSSGDVLIEIWSNDFYNFLSYIKSNDGYEDESENEKLVSIIEKMFPMLTSKSQIEILESNFANYLQFVPVEGIKRLLLKIESPYFAINFIQIKLINNIKNYEDYGYSIDPLLELLYWFEDLLLREFSSSRMELEHQCINQETK